MHQFHFSIDDLFWSVIQLSDWNLPVSHQPLLGFLANLHSETGAVSDLQVFGRAHALDGRARHLSEVTASAAERLGAMPGFRWGPHALDYATPPHAQHPAEAHTTFQALFGDIARFCPAAQRSPWLRLHYFSELHELAALFRANGVHALMTTDKPALCYRLPEAQKRELHRAGRTEFGGIGFVTSHLRLEFFLEDAVDPARFCARMDAAHDRHGFVTLFTHEVELDNPQCRSLLVSACQHAARAGWI